jgi:hypothetical protein
MRSQRFHDIVASFAGAGLYLHAFGYDAPLGPSPVQADCPFKHDASVTTGGGR